ncbi:metallophosphoesterase [Carboxylicivirga sediminis]|uniref:Metallophosphoesterase n=1 Tax=Carboxylicivirga sediminis TaxID=2006564 RepID=A0A941IZN4_9BACT|nr:metallophosphoesterase [Carboxylicivirga sediminis]MBR8538005.1 metallophosphoesterase [Carboxylicivirga sediminis]
MTARHNEAHQDEHFYDIIGDVHGHHIQLQKLLLQMDYTLVNGVWSHAYRVAVFVGDFINRGPNSKGVIQIIRDMVNAGTALAILGNHEVNAILYFTKDDEGEPLRIPGNNNSKLLYKFAREYNGNKEALKRDIKWLRSLPLHLCLNGIRVVHAYWNDAHIRQLEGLYTDGRIKKGMLKHLLNDADDLSKAFFETIKGIELSMPKDLIIKDEQNIKRDNFRVKWWMIPKGKTFKTLSYGNKFELPDYTIPTEIIDEYEVYPENAPIVFIGHYCMGRGPMIPTNNVCCVDACVTGSGRLAAYRYSGEKALDESNFVFVKR